MIHKSKWCAICGLVFFASLCLISCSEEQDAVDGLDQYEELEAQIDRVNQEKELLSGRNMALVGRIDSFQSELDSVKQEASALKAYIISLEDSLNLSSGELDSLKYIHGKLEKSYGQLLLVVDSLRDRVEKSPPASMDEVKEVEEKLEVIEEEKRKIKEDEEREAYRQLVQQMAILRQKYDKLAEDKERSDQKVAKLDGQLSAQSRKVDSLKEKSKRDSSSFAAQIGTSQTKIGDLESDLNDAIVAKQEAKKETIKFTHRAYYHYKEGKRVNVREDEPIAKKLGEVWLSVDCGDSKALANKDGIIRITLTYYVQPDDSPKAPLMVDTKAPSFEAKDGYFESPYETKEIKAGEVAEFKVKIPKALRKPGRHRYRIYLTDSSFEYLDEGEFKSY